MRIWVWGQADAEAADFTFIETSHRTTLGPWGYAVNDSETDAGVNQADMEFGQSGTGFTHELVLRLLLDQLKAKLGQVPVLLAADLMLNTLTTAGTESGTAVVRRMITYPDVGDSSNWRRDKSLDIDWYQDRKHMVRGQDVEDQILHSSPWSQNTSDGVWNAIAIRDVVERALRDNIDVWAHLSETHVLGSTPTSGINFHAKPATQYDLRPYVRYAYLYPIEFYHDDGSGDLDISSPITDNPGDEFYIGAVEPGQTGTPTKGHIRNYSDATQHVEVFDDHPEYTTPITRIGTGQLDFITLADNAVSQKYTPTFYSATQYEVKAEAYRDNAVSLHPTINADAAWRGDVSSTFTAPSGGLSIPASAWQAATMATSDEVETGVRGQTTDSAWPADSNDQVEITKDDGGSADATAWRPILGHREMTTGQVTIDATTKLIPTRMVVPAEWPVDTKAFIQDQTNINEGEISSIQEMDVGTPSHVGTGTDDFSISGNFNGIWTNTLRVKIDGTGSPDTFTWSMDNGSTWEATGVNCSTSPILLQDGLYVQWTSATGHTLDDYWNTAIKAWAVELKSLTANSNVYNSGSIIATTLPIRDVLSSVFTTVDQPSGVSQGTPARIYVASTVGFATSDEIFIQNPSDPTSAEYRTVDSVVTGQYIDVTVALTEDYPIGSFVAELGTGEDAFWMRPVATAITAEELKRFRLNARLL
jgi:hypothetical protein